MSAKAQDWSNTPYAHMDMPKERPKTLSDFHHRRILAALAPRLEAADALAEAVREMLGQGGGNPLYTSWGERVDDAAALAALAAYDATKKGEADG